MSVMACITSPFGRTAIRNRCAGLSVFTADLHHLADWLRSCGVKTVAMQSTGVYWIPIYEILEDRGFEVYLVNARHTRNLPGRKSDVQESQWLLKLHTYGLLNNSFQPLRRFVCFVPTGGNGENTCVERRRVFNACRKR